MRLCLSSMHILLIEDDVLAAEYLTKGLGECGHVVDHAADGNVGLNLALNGHYDVIVVDRMLPGRDGLTIIRMLRADRNQTPALVLSALGEVDNRVEGLRRGATITWSSPTPSANCWHGWRHWPGATSRRHSNSTCR